MGANMGKNCCGGNYCVGSMAGGVSGGCGRTQHYEQARGESGELPDTSASIQMILF
jgi:hypothetical protein